MPATPRKITLIAAFAALYLIWGSTYLAILLAIQSIPPFLMAGARFFLAGVIMYTFSRAQGSPRPSPESWRNAFIVGGCLLLFGNGGVTLSEKWVPTGLAALLVATVPIYITLLGWITGVAPAPKPSVWIGLIGGFIGVGVLVGNAFTQPAGSSPNDHLLLGMFILLVGSLVWSAGSLYSRQTTTSSSPFLAAAQQMLCGGALLALAGLVRGEHHGFSPNQITSHSLMAFVYLVLIGALVGFPAYIFLLRHCDPAKVATYAYVNPVVAIFLGTFFNGEQLTVRILLGAGLIIGAVAVVITAQQFSPAKAPVPDPTLDCAR